MELSTATATSTKPPAPKRQETLGPSSPIQDWEVERATVIKKTRIILSLFTLDTNTIYHIDLGRV